MSSGKKFFKGSNVRDRKLFFVPGVSQVAGLSEQELYEGCIFHRSEDFENLYTSIEKKLQTIFKTKNRIFIITSSGTGGMEACVSNFVKNSDNILVVEAGKYGQRWGELLTSINVKYTPLKLEWGKSLELDLLERFLKKISNPDIVFLTHSETSTGALFDIENIVKIIKKYFNCLIIVDAIGTIGAAEFEADKWNIDVSVSVSQKGLMGPPGLSFLSVNKKALKKMQVGDFPKYYFDLNKYDSNAVKKQTPFTPGSMQLIHLKKSLDYMISIGLENIIKNVEHFSLLFREALQKMDFSFFPDNPSSVISVINTNKNPEQFIVKLKEKHNVMVAQGAGKIKDKTVRVSHIGLFSDHQIQYLIDLFKIYHYLLL